MMVIDLIPVWILILGLAVFMYVLLDGFDLGVGILFPFAPDDASRNLMMDSVAPIWDGNETWLILGGIGLFAAFPLAFAIIIPASYFPILVMLLGLIFRGVAFEFRMKAHRSRFLWDHAFFWGSLLATFAQGVVLGSDGTLLDRLRRTCDQHLAQHRPAQHQPVGRGFVAQVSGLPIDRNAVPSADHRDVHRLVLLCVSRQGPKRRRLSLNALLR